MRYHHSGHHLCGSLTCYNPPPLTPPLPPPPPKYLPPSTLANRLSSTFGLISGSTGKEKKPKKHSGNSSVVTNKFVIAIAILVVIMNGSFCIIYLHVQRIIFLDNIALTRSGSILEEFVCMYKSSL